MTTRTLILRSITPLALIACNGSPESADASAAGSVEAAPVSVSVPVSVTSATTGRVAQAVVATGTYGPRDEIPLSFKIGGVIARVHVDEGAPVRAGQVLAVLDLREIDAVVDKARAGVDKAERDAARLARLAADSVATRVQLQDATSALDAARADLESAHVNREYATIIAPERGIVLQRMATPGATIGAGTPVLILGGSTRGRVLRAGLPDRDALRVRVGDSATVRFAAVPDATYQGVVSLLGQAADPRTGTFTVEVQLRDAAPMPAGLVGRVEITTRAPVTATLIPVDALIEADADSALVYTMTSAAPHTAEAHRVHILQVAGGLAAVTGVEPGARVITRGAAYVRPGAPVRLAPLAATVMATERRP